MNKHQKTAKFCLIKQKKELICEYCNNASFSDKDFEYHQNHSFLYLLIYNLINHRHYYYLNMILHL
jgi:hypothetical protein